MSRIAKIPIIVPDSVKVEINGQNILIKGKNGKLIYNIHKNICIKYSNNQLTFSFYKNYLNSKALAGTTRSILNSMVIGVTHGFTKKIKLVGIGYRAIIEENIVSLFLGYSHIINYKLPTNIIVKCLNQNEIIISGADKQIVGQVAADLRSYRIPDSYKGKGIRYYDEIVRIKEAKKK